MSEQKRVVVGLSGGVDSSVSAYLLKEQGYEVVGMFMKNWHDESVTLSDDCPWLDDSNDALVVAEQLGIPFQTIDLSKEYKERIVDYMFSEYENGRTPNPDVLCNREIKFDVFLKAAMDLGADYVATGHYVQKTTSKDGAHHLISGADPNKDQSYFLCQLTQEQLAKSIFPIGHLQKSDVRKIAEEAGLATAGKKDSQGLCFVGKIKLPVFLQQQLSTKEGSVIEIPTDLSRLIDYHRLDTSEIKTLAEPFNFREEEGKEVGKHNGAHFYTIGQRKGLAIGGTPLPLFVIGTNVKTNTIYVGQGDNHPGLNRRALKIEADSAYFQNKAHHLSEGESAPYDFRIRYRQELQKGTLHFIDGAYYILFNQPQKGITPGQFAAWYKEGELMGSGVIES